MKESMDKQIIYILSPAKRETGGVELLHQLRYKLELMGYEAYMVYDGTMHADPIPDQYREKYRVKFVGSVDVERGLFIIPEVALDFCTIPRFQNARTIIWWLSVDNALAFTTKEEIKRILNDRPDILHFSQSRYAMEFLTKELDVPKIKIFELSDYINSIYLDAGENENKRDDVVLFNPAKGLEKTVRLIAKSDARVKWRALKGLTPVQMKKVMSESKVYVDFGNHPGKDRIPREAAVCGCCVITNRNGSAMNDEDVPILPKYKIESEDNEPVLEKIYDLIQNYDVRVNDYKDYVAITLTEFRKFEVDVLRAFKRIFCEEQAVHSIDETIANISELIRQEDIVNAFRDLIEYRLNGGNNTEEILILESNIRMQNGEYEEAKFSALEGLSISETKYELYLLLTENEFINNRHNVAKMMEYGKETLDYSEKYASEEEKEYIHSVIDDILTEIEKDS